MTVAIAADGDQLTVISTEHTLTTITTAGTLLLKVDLSTLGANDIVELRIYTKVRSGGTERLEHRATYGPSPLGTPIVASIPIVSAVSFRPTLKQTAGSVRTFPWAVYSV